LEERVGWLGEELVDMYVVLVACGGTLSPLLEKRAKGKAPSQPGHR
jgi:hypothetical protein